MRKKLSAIVLCFCILISAVVPVNATQKTTPIDEIQSTCPTIFIHGFACGDIYSNLGTEDETVVWPMQSDVIMTAVEKAVKPIADYLLTHNWAKFEDALIEVVNILFEGAWNNPDGSAKEGTGIDWTYPEQIDPTSTVDFCYDWRGDPLEIADQLADFIDYVLIKTGSEKVAIECHSMGGIIFISYAAKYGLDKIHGAIMDSTAVYGASYIGKLFTNEFVLDGEAIYSYLLFAMTGNEYEEVLNFLFDTLFAMGVFDILECAAEELVRRSMERVARECLIPLFGYWTSVWAMLSDADFEKAESFVFDTLLIDKTEEHTVLRNRINAYNDQVRVKRDDILQQLAEKERLMVISRYGFSMAPVSSTWSMQSDGVIDTAYSSFGATAANYGSYLSEEYLAEHKQAGYISPDSIVDASTCAFPDVTWFIKCYPHSNYTVALSALKNAVLFADEPVNIHSYAEYPQYMISANGTIVPFESYEKEPCNPLYAYGKLMQYIRDKLEELFKTIFDKVASLFVMPA